MNGGRGRTGVTAHGAAVLAGRARPRSPGRPAAFTLLEVVLAMGLAFFLLAVLYQTISLHLQYQRLAESEMRQPQIARTLLHRIAAELRSVPPATAMRSPAPISRSAQTLLHVGEPTDTVLPNVDLEITGPSALAEAPGPAPASFRLLGTPTRLLLFVRRDSPDPFAGGAVTNPKSNVTGEHPETKPLRRSEVSAKPGTLRQVLYLARPLPWEQLQNPLAAAGSSAESGDSSADPSTEELRPLYLGVVRQEIRQPFSPDAQIEAVLQLREFVGVTESSAKPSPAPEQTRTAEPNAEQQAIRGLVDTAVLTQDVAMLRFRYHDGRQWFDRWEQPDRLPVAVEIQLSFDPRAADPDYVAVQQSAEAAESPSVSRTGEPAEEPLFPYRLVVALPVALPSLAPAPGDPFQEPLP